MDSNNLSHQIILHYGIALGAVLVVMLVPIADLQLSTWIAIIGWAAFCWAGYLSVQHAGR
ncbi:MAG: hypothetical protein K8J31_08845 [Anaerolineae bacterium]|nr:hypothetical protein [Anaerolineae bacterium]